MKRYITIAAVSITVILVGNIVLQNIANFTPEKVFIKYTDLMRVNGYRKAYKACFSHGYRERIEFPTFAKIQVENAKALGFVVDKKILKAKMLKDRKRRSAYVIISLGLYPTGAITESYFFTRDFTGWKISGFDIRSPLLDRIVIDERETFLGSLPEGIRESYNRILESQGRPAQ